MAPSRDTGGTDLLPTRSFSNFHSQIRFSDWLTHNMNLAIHQTRFSHLSVSILVNVEVQFNLCIIFITYRKPISLIYSLIHSKWRRLCPHLKPIRVTRSIGLFVLAETAVHGMESHRGVNRIAFTERIYCSHPSAFSMHGRETWIDAKVSREFMLECSFQFLNRNWIQAWRTDFF